LPRNPNQKFPNRIDLLCQALFGETPESNPDLMNLRYQLLTGCAGALIEAKRIGAAAAVFVVHVFISDAVDDDKVRMNDRDYDRFLKCLGCAGDDNIGDESLIGPVTVPGGPFVPSDMPLYVGKVKAEVSIKSILQRGGQT
jgi:hypothetical protein